MSAPFRTPSGTPCPRCALVLVNADGVRACPDGCGTWVDNTRLPLEPGDLPGISRGTPVHATALPFTRCVVCKLSLNDLYKGDHTVLVLGQCLDHGIWIERGDLAAFDEVYAAVLPRLAEVRARRETEAEAARRERERREAEAEAARRERERREQHDHAIAELPDILQQLVRRVELLEHQVAQLKHQLAERE